MSISIKKNKMPKLKKCEMLCDKPLDKKLNEYELTKFLNCHCSNLLIGPPNSGKTSTLYAMLTGPLKNIYHNIYLFMPSSSRRSMKDDIFEDIDEEKKYDELNLENLEDCFEKIQEEPEYNHAIIFDDVTSSLKDKEIAKLLKKINYNRRHNHISIFFLTQTYLSLNPDIRKVFTNLFIINNIAPLEFDKIIEEQTKTINKKNAEQIYKMAFDTPHNFLFINTPSQKIFKNWDEIIIS